MLRGMNTTPARGLAIVGRSSDGRPRSYRLEPRSRSGGRDAAYRRLATVILRLDVTSLGAELRAARLGLGLARAA